MRAARSLQPPQLVGFSFLTFRAPAIFLCLQVLFRAEICVISSLSEDYCHIVTPPDIWGVELRTRIYLGHYHEFHYVSTRPVG